MKRLLNAFRCFFRALTDGNFPNQQKQDPLKDAKLLLAFLQEEGRLVDFLQEDISEFDDEQIGAAAREVHEKTRKALNKIFTIESVTQQSEGESIKIVENFEKNAIQLVGNVAGAPPYTGTVQHHGWRIVESKKLPAQEDSSVIAKAEIEI
ncbi:DUF2760 domain-containing protein [Candidatus Uabimicrobium sp. HlEnr_7]|uniref:DUF2760 domain-containing protein n=1 Tax=Candidatus Uabimicrobium helgolandensis TaxID=3095367 RepID=UPI003557924B